MVEEYGKAKLVEQFANLGISAGDRIIVHSSFKSIGPVAGGIETLLQAMMDVITPAGTIMMPVFNSPVELWRSAEQPSRVGAVTEVFRRLPDTVRSIHPTHSVAVWGDGAEEWAAGHLEAGALSKDSPMHRFAKAGAKVVSIGTNFTTVSLIHVSESIAKIPYLDFGYTGYNQSHRILLEDGKEIEYIEKEKPGDSVAFGVVEAKMRTQGQLTEGLLGNARVIVADGGQILEASLEVLDADPAGLLCDNPRCKVCPRRKELLAERL